MLYPPGYKPAIRRVRADVVGQAAAQRLQSGQYLQDSFLQKGARLCSNPEIVRLDVATHLYLEPKRTDNFRPKFWLHSLKIVFSQIGLIQPFVQFALIEPAKIRCGHHQQSVRLHQLRVNPQQVRPVAEMSNQSK